MKFINWGLGIISILVVLLIWGGLVLDDITSSYKLARMNGLKKSEAILNTLLDLFIMGIKIAFALGIGYIIFLGLSVYWNMY